MRFGSFFIEPRSLGFGFLVGAAAGGAATVVCVRRDLLPQQLIGERKPVTVLPPEDSARPKPPALAAHYEHPALKYGAPTSGFGVQTMRVFDGFVAAFDSRTRNPSWVLEHLTWYDEPIIAGDRKRSIFWEDPAIEERFRTKNADFLNSGYDRGHLAAAANHKKSQKAMDDTFTLTNISPQVGEGFNRDYWARFEKFTRDLLKVSSAVFIATGPIWLPNKKAEGEYVMTYPMIGQPPALVSVPTHFYKVILAEPRDHDDSSETNAGNSFAAAKCAVAAFVMPNRSIHQDIPLTRFAVPISDLETATGLKFFPKFMTAEKRTLLDRAALVWRSIGQALQGKSNKPLLETLDGTQPESKKEQPKSSSTNIQNVKKKGGASPIIARNCGLEPHLCYHTECTLPPPFFWKKTSTATDKTQGPTGSA